MPEPIIREQTIDAKADEAQGRVVPALSKAVDLARRTIEVVASTNRVDRDGEIIRPDAFAPGLQRFMDSNAPLLGAHTHRGDSGQPTQVGWVLDARIEKTRVVMTLRFADTDAGRQWWALASDPEGKGIALSIGFRPVRYIYGTAKEILGQFPDLRQPIREAGLDDDDRIRVYTEIELYELSCVPVPSNRLALQIRAAAKALGLDAGDETGGQAAVDLLAGKIAEIVLRDLQSEIRNLKSEIVNLIVYALPDLAGVAEAGHASPAASDAPRPAAQGEGDKGAARASAERLLAAINAST